MNARRVLTLLVLAAALAAAPSAGRSPAAAATTGCQASFVHYSPYPGGAPGLAQLPWIRASSRGLGAVGLLWYWPQQWRAQGIARALIYPGGQEPGGGRDMKVLWAFLSARGKRLARGNLVLQGRRLDAPGKTWQQFGPIVYAGQHGAPSYASTVRLPAEGCWQVRLSAGAAHASVVFQATAAP